MRLLSLILLFPFSLLVGPARAGETSPPDTTSNDPHALEQSGTQPKVDRQATAQLQTVTVQGTTTAEPMVRPVSVLSGVDLDDSRSGTLGQTVANIPGVQTTAFGQGAGRPVIRGFDGPRISVLADGMGSGDVSSISQDHAVSIDPFLADRIEILKGPSTLLYGPGAIGGVVNVDDGRIPQAMPLDGINGRMQAGYDSVSNGRSGVFRIDSGWRGFALHADGLSRRDGDYDLPDRTLPNSAVRTHSGALGGSWIGDWGYVGAAVSRYLDNYDNPAEPGHVDSGEAPVHLQLQQTRYDIKGALNAPLPGIEKLEFALGHSDYQHTEFEGQTPATVFTNNADEARALLTTRPHAGWVGALGVQAVYRDFAAVGDETFVPPTTTRGIGVFATGHRDFERFNIDLGARIDRQDSQPASGVERRFHPNNLSAALTWRMSEAWHWTLNLDRAQRAPAEEELFANGPHSASATYEIGNPLLGVETANQVELGLHYHGQRVEAKLTTYLNRYDDFIYLADTGRSEDGFPVRQWSQGNALFRGGEAEATIHLATLASGHYDLRLWGDAVRAVLRQGGNLPRIPAARLGGVLRWHTDTWRASLGVTRYFSQTDAAAFETSTPGFTMITAHLAWAFLNTDRMSWEVYVDGNNLGNRLARLSTSLIKDAAPLPGRNVSVGIRGMF